MKNINESLFSVWDFRLQMEQFDDMRVLDLNSRKHRVKERLKVLVAEILLNIEKLIVEIIKVWGRCFKIFMVVEKVHP